MGLLSKLNNKLLKMFDPPTQHCDGCGEEYPTHYLTHVSDWIGDFCKRCLVYESDSNE